eukprot:TRINITY_DN4330_c0_g1_i2.p1 TRINITY_DN4330_c0_g1~~TRINITY_DN4330_c0_g1_i2.p1  ORF type:complete len:408 (-),score=96.52 TRINITY_DN4330_c0_g1_i2:108-1331(-)
MDRIGVEWLDQACPRDLGWIEIPNDISGFIRSNGQSRDYLMHRPLQQMSRQMRMILSPQSLKSPKGFFALDQLPGPRAVTAVEFYSTAEGHEDLVHGGAMATIVDVVMGQLCMHSQQEMVVTISFTAKYLKPMFRRRRDAQDGEDANQIYRLDVVASPTHRPDFLKATGVIYLPEDVANLSENQNIQPMAEFVGWFLNPAARLNGALPPALQVDCNSDRYPECAHFTMKTKVPFPRVGWVEDMRKAPEYQNHTEEIFAAYEDWIKNRVHGGQDFMYASPKILVEYFSHKSDDTIHCAFHFLPTAEGPPGCVHGGAIFTAFDDAFTTYANLAFGSREQPMMALTANLELRYVKLTPIAKTYKIIVKLEKQERSKVFLVAQMIDPETSTLHSEAKALFIMKPMKLKSSL